jgi:hypothetical protein
MKNNTLKSFADWYVANREGKGARYIKIHFENDRKRFEKILAESATAFEKTFSYNPFEMEQKDLPQYRKDIYNENSAFFAYSQTVTKQMPHIPRALLGANNYITFLMEQWQEPREESQEETQGETTTESRFVVTAEMDEQTFLQLSKNKSVEIVKIIAK